MKRLLFKTLGLILVISAMGCVPSLHQLYTDETIIFDEALVGIWKDNDSSWQFEKGTNKGYKLTMTDDEGKTGIFETHLVEIGDYCYLDLYPSVVRLTDCILK